MANKAKKNNKNLIIGICAAVVVVIVIIVAIVLASSGSKLNDQFFVSDGSKYVLTMDADEMGMEGEEYSPNRVHVVYFYSGDTVTSLQSFYEYTDEAAAKSAFEAFKELGEEGDYKLDGRYIVLTAPEDEYKDMTATDVKQQVEFLQSLKNMDIDEVEDADDADDVEIIEDEDAE